MRSKQGMSCLGTTWNKAGSTQNELEPTGANLNKMELATYQTN